MSEAGPEGLVNKRVENTPLVARILPGHYPV